MTLIKEAVTRRKKTPLKSLRSLIETMIETEEWVMGTGYLETGEMRQIRQKKPQVLHMFSGKSDRSDGLKAHLASKTRFGM